MIPFELAEPASLEEAITLIDPDDPDVRPIAGGTALMLMMKAGVFRPRRLVSLRKLNGSMTGIVVEDLLTGYYETALKPNELITSLTIPPQTTGRTAYLKVTSGSADDWPALGVAAAIDFQGDTVKAARIVVSAATSKATRLATAEKLLTGAAINDKVLGDVGEAAVAEAVIIGDLRGSAAYKRELLRVYIGRAIREANENS